MAWAIGQIKKFAVFLLCAGAALTLFFVGSASDSLANELPAYAAGTTPPLLVGGWQLSPTLFAGAVYNTNVNQSSTNAVSSWGERVTPGLSAILDNGIYKTSLYGVADIQNYANSGANNTIYANAGFTQTYLPLPDLTFQLSGGFSRTTDIFGSSALANINTAAPATTPFPPAATTTVSPQVNSNPYNQFSGAFSVEKSFGRTFVGLTTSVVNTQYAGVPATMTSSNGTVYTVTGRAGFDLTPQLYAFVDPSVNWQRYADSTLNSDGYRITAGVGTAKTGIWRGEVYTGYQAEKNDIVGTYNSPVLGLRIGYSPIPIWDFSASVDENSWRANSSDSWGNNRCGEPGYYGAYERCL